jgi:uroporphyrinogen decarboxylase
MKCDTLSSRERVNLAMRRQAVDRIPRYDSFWGDTLRRWRQEGHLGEQVWPGDLFDFDLIGAGWINATARLDAAKVLERSAEWDLHLSGNGAKLRYWRHKSGTPEHVGFTIVDEESWLPYKRDLLATPLTRRVDLDACRRAMQRAQELQRWFCWTGVECFEIAKDYIGHERICIAMAEDEAWLTDLFETLTTVTLQVLDYLAANGIRFDGGWIYGDIAYNHAPFCSPAMYRRFVMPSHRRQVNWFKDRGVPVIYHTDGDFRPLIPSFLELGIDCFQPLEAKANMDLRELKPKYGHQVSFMGNIDVMKLITNDPAIIEAEVAAKIPLAKVGGGYIYHSDHSIPPQVSWASYQWLMQLVARYGAS